MTPTIDLKDRKILYELDRDSRQANKQIAHKVGLSEQVVGNRIKRLLDLKIIDYFYVKINPATLGYMHIKIYLRLHNITKEKEDLLVQDLNSQPGVFWLASLRGKYDLEVSIYVKNLSEFSQKYDELLGKWGEYILERNVVLLEKAYTYTKAYLVPLQKPELFIYGEGKEIVSLDNIDFSLLHILSKEGRKSLVEIATQLKISSDTIRYRIRHLQQKKVITGFSVKLNFKNMGHNYHLILLKLQNMNKEKYAKLESLAKLNKNLIIYMKTLGDHDIELEVETASKEELDLLLKSLRDNFVMEIKDYEIIEVINEYQMNYFPF